MKQSFCEIIMAFYWCKKQEIIPLIVSKLVSINPSCFWRNSRSFSATCTSVRGTFLQTSSSSQHQNSAKAAASLQRCHVPAKNIVVNLNGIKSSSNTTGKCGTKIVSNCIQSGRLEIFLWTISTWLKNSLQQRFLLLFSMHR